MKNIFKITTLILTLSLLTTSCSKETESSIEASAELVNLGSSKYSLKLSIDDFKGGNEETDIITFRVAALEDADGKRIPGTIGDAALIQIFHEHFDSDVPGGVLYIPQTIVNWSSHIKFRGAKRTVNIELKNPLVKRMHFSITRNGYTAGNVSLTKEFE